MTYILMSLVSVQSEDSGLNQEPYWAQNAFMHSFSRGPNGSVEQHCDVGQQKAEQREQHQQSTVAAWSDQE